MGGRGSSSSSYYKMAEYVREAQKLERQIKSLRTRSRKYEANKNYNLNKEEANKSAKKLDEINDKIKSLEQKRTDYLKKLDKVRKRKSSSFNDDELPF